MIKNVKLSLDFYSNIFLSTRPNARILLSFPRFPIQRVCSLGQNPQALVWKWRQNCTFKINVPTVNGPASTNKVSIFKLTIEDYFKNHSELIGFEFFLPLAPIKSVTFFLGHPIFVSISLPALAL